MNNKIGKWSSIGNAAAVFGFAISMIAGSAYAGYITSIFIALTFVPMISSLASKSKPEHRAFASTAIAFSAIYATLILIVYFTQVTVVMHGNLSPELLAIFDYQQFGLFFALNLLGYAIMALSTLFIGFCIVSVNSKTDTWLKWLLLIHGVFFAIIILPMLNVFTPDMEGGDWIGTVVLIFWCVYFIPVGILSYVHFEKNQ